MNYLSLLKNTPKNLKIMSWVFIALGFFLLSTGSLISLWNSHLAQKEKDIYLNLPSAEADTLVDGFPLGVDPAKKEIIENPLLELYLETYLSFESNNQHRQNNWLNRTLAKISTWNLYQQLASPRSRTLVIYSGERKEEVVKNFGSILRWSKTDRDTFTKAITKAEPLLEEGKFFPGRYVVDIDNSSPETVASMVQDKFTTEILNKYHTSISDKVPLADALIIASLLEREAYDFTDMRIISGIIWNRLFIDMPLQLDASLQYVRGNNIYEPKWWPIVKPSDKYITSPYNTYQNKGLPPTPIANPSAEAVIAALNPRQTDCLFYFHDQNGKFYCSEDYKEHVAMLKKIYGRGR